MSNAAAVTLVGRAGTHPQLSVGMTGDRVSFRVVATERYWDKATEQWVDGDEFGVSVICWKTLATTVLNAIRKGDPVIVSGRILTRRYEKDGVMQYFTEVKADFVGLDVSKVGARFTRNPMEHRENSDPSTSANQPATLESPTTPSDPVDPPDDDFGAPWDAGTSDRNGELVSVD